MTNYDHSSAAKTTSIICQKAVRGVVRGLEQWLLSTNNVVGGSGMYYVLNEDPNARDFVKL